jgi:hypothetical protein
MTCRVRAFILRCKKIAAYTPATLPRCHVYLEDIAHV